MLQVSGQTKAMRRSQLNSMSFLQCLGKERRVAAMRVASACTEGLAPGPSIVAHAFGCHMHPASDLLTRKCECCSWEAMCTPCCYMDTPSGAALPLEHLEEAVQQCEA